VVSSRGDGQESRAGGRLVFLDGIRALAAIAVVWHHGYQTVGGDGSIQRHLSFLRYGNFAVAVFIVISGYSLAIAASRRGHSQRFWSFIRRRAWRILPPYLAALVFSTILILTAIGSTTGTPWDLVLPLSWSGVSVNALLFQDVLTVRPPNHVFWSIAVEWHLYFVFPLLIALRRRVPRTCLLVIAALGCGALWLGYEGKPYVGFPPQFFGLFVLGVLAGDLATDESRRARRISSWFRPWWTIVAATLAVPLAVVLVGADPSYFASELVLGGAVAALVVALTAAPADHPARRLLGWRPVAWVGLFSYSLYLTHAPVLQIIWQYGVRPLRLSPNAEFAATLFGATAASLAVAFLFHLLFERPFMNHRSVRAMAAALRRARPPSSVALTESSSADEWVSSLEAERSTQPPLERSSSPSAAQVLAAGEDCHEAVRAAAYRRLAAAPSWVLWMALGRCSRRAELLYVLEQEAATDRLTAFVLERTSSPDVGDRVLAMELTGHLLSGSEGGAGRGTPAMLAAALNALADADAVVRRAAAAQLGGRDQAVPGLAAALRDDPDPAVRQAAALALAGDGSETTLLALVGALQDPETGVRRMATEQTLRIMDERAHTTGTSSLGV